MSHLSKSDRVFEQIFGHGIIEHLSVIESLRARRPILERIATEMAHAILIGNKIQWCGNGGSRCRLSILAEFVARFRRERRGLRSIALTTEHFRSYLHQ